MSAWTAYAGLTGAVITGFLALARISQDLLRDSEAGLTTVSDGLHPSNHQSTADPADESPARKPHREEPAAANGDAVGADAGTAEPEAGLVGQTERDDTASRQAAVPELSQGALLANVALTQGVFGVVLVAGAWILDIPAAAFGVTRAPSSIGLPAVLIGLGVGVAFWAGNELASAIAAVSTVDYDERLRSLLAPTSTGGWLVLLGAVLPTVALVEELVFRAALIGVVSAGFGTSPWALAVVSAAAFALGHGAQGRVGVAVTGVLGFALAAVFVLTGSLLAVVLAHYLVNALEFLVHEGLGFPDPLWGAKAG